jgi:hypothetical protein
LKRKGHEDSTIYTTNGKLFHLNQKFFIAHKFKKNAFIQGIQHSRDGHGSGGAVAVEFLNIRRGPSALVGGFFLQKSDVFHFSQVFDSTHFFDSTGFFYKLTENLKFQVFTLDF